MLDDPEAPRVAYQVVVPREMNAQNQLKKKISSKASDLKWAGVRTNRQFFNQFSRVFRWVNDMSFGISLVFLIIAVVGAIMEKTSLSTFSMGMVVFLNAVGVIAGVSNMIAVRFRGNPVKGALFLFPPMTVYYLWKNWSKWQKSINRVKTPLLMLVFVFFAYRWFPWLSEHQESDATWSDTAKTIRADMKDSVSEARQKLGKLPDKVNLELKKAKVDELEKRASEVVDDVKEKIQKATGNDASAPARDEPAAPRRP